MAIAAWLNTSIVTGSGGSRGREAAAPTGMAIFQTTSAQGQTWLPQIGGTFTIDCLAAYD